jgi:Collagen triple helix repeat (20 copies)
MQVRGGESMFAAIRRNLTFANVTITAIVIFAVVGVGYAGSKVIITSTKQISPKVVKQLTGKPGKTGTSGPAGSAGPAGATGPIGPAGPAGATGAVGATGTTGAKGETGAPGKEGSPWTVGGTLPAGKSETGQWGVSQYMPKTETYEFMDVGLSFPIPLAAGLGAEQVHFIALGEGENEEESKWAPAIKEHKCKGSVAKPEAMTGNLCVFTATSINWGGTPGVESIAFSLEDAETSEEGAGRSGAVLGFGGKLPKAGFVVAKGDWVVTG